MGKLFEELKRRKVFKVAAVYAVVAWLLIQVAATVTPALQLPQWTPALVTVLLILGFIPSLIAAWAYELTPEGVRPESASLSTSHAPLPSSDRRLIYATFGLVLLVAGFQIADRFLSTSTDSNRVTSTNDTPVSPAGSLRVNLDLGEAQLFPGIGMFGRFDISPDGQQLVYTTNLEDDRTETKIRDLATGESIVLSAAAIGQNVIAPVFSPDGQSLLVSTGIYRATRNDLYVTTANGSGARQLSSVSALTMANWFSEQTVIFHSLDTGGLVTQDVRGGAPEAIPIPVGPDDYVGLPNRVADTAWILYAIRGRSEFMDVARTHAFNLETGENKLLLDRAYNARYTPSGHIVFMREGDLWAVPLDADLMELAGSAAIIEQGVEHRTFLGGLASYTFSDTGRFLFRPGVNGYAREQAGAELREIAGDSIPNAIPANAVQGRFSPDGGSIVFAMQEENGDSYIAVYNIAQQILARRTFGNNADRPLWTPDGRQIVYREHNGDSYGLWVINADGSGQREQLLNATASLSPTSFSPDGSQLIFSQGTANETGVQRLALGDSERPIMDLFSDAVEADSAEISPDGNWVVHGSRELGQYRVFVRPFPNVDDGKWMVSELTAREAHWGPDGSLYIISPGGGIYHIGVEIQSGFATEFPEFATPEFLVLSNWTGPLEPNFSISPDGQHLLYRRPESEGFIQNDILVLEDNWFERLHKLAPRDGN